MSEQECRRRGQRLREQLRSLGAPFRQENYRQQLLSQCQDLAGSALEGMVNGVAKEIDRVATRETSRRQRTLFDLDDEYKLGDNRRIAKRAARLDHMEESLRLSAANLTAVQERHQERVEERDLLLPYFQPGSSKEQAVAAYYAANPQSDAS